MAAWSIMVGSVVVVVSGFETITGLHSLETREAIERALATAPADGLGLDVSAVQQMIRVGSMVAAGCATAAAILGYQVLQRNRTARIVLSILAVPLFLTGMASGGFFSSLVAVAVGMLWLHPARAWFNGTWRPDLDRAGLERSLPPLPGRRRPAAGTSGRGRRRPRRHRDPPPRRPRRGRAASAGGASRPGLRGSAAVRRAALGRAVPDRTTPPRGYATPGWPVAVPPTRPRRPAALIWAAVLTWVFGGVALLSTGAAVLVLATDAGPVLDELHRQQPDLAARGVSDQVIVTMTYVMSAVVALWSVVAMALAGLAFAGFSWARLALVACVAASAVLLLVSVVVGQIVLLLPLVAAVATCAFLLRPEVRRWFATQRGPMGS